MSYKIDTKHIIHFCMPSMKCGKFKEIETDDIGICHDCGESFILP